MDELSGFLLLFYFAGGWFLFFFLLRLMRYFIYFFGWLCSFFSKWGWDDEMNLNYHNVIESFCRVMRCRGTARES